MLNVISRWVSYFRDAPPPDKVEQLRQEQDALTKLFRREINTIENRKARQQRSIIRDGLTGESYDVSARYSPTDIKLK
jgi:hypothetical protein